MDELLASPLFRVGLLVVAALVVGKLLLRYLFPPKPGPLMVRVRCASCGWTGTVGKHNRKCSRCTSTALEEVR